MEYYRQKYLPAHAAARLLGVTPTRLRELAEAGVLRSFGQGQWQYSRDDIGHLLGREIDDKDLEFCAERHKSRLDANARYNAKRPKPERAAFNPVRFGDTLTQGTN